MTALDDCSWTFGPTHSPGHMSSSPSVTSTTLLSVLQGLYARAGWEVTRKGEEDAQGKVVLAGPTISLNEIVPANKTTFIHKLGHPVRSSGPKVRGLVTPLDL